jgi:drug/metabolite transporter (DMT)-like permease
MGLKHLILLSGVFACSTAILFIKASAIHPVYLSGLRLAIAAVFLFPAFLKQLHEHHQHIPYNWSASILPGIVLGLHFITWIVGARMTSSANATLIVNLVPVVMPFFLAVQIHEKLSRIEWVGTLASALGLAVLIFADFDRSKRTLPGDALCFLAMLLFCVYLVLGRQNRHRPVWLYVVPLYAVAGVFCLALTPLFVNPFHPMPFREILLVLGLGLLPTVLGHSALNFSMKHFRGQVVSVVNMGQFVFAGALAFAFFHEIPAWSFYPAGMLFVLSGILVWKDDIGESSE